MPPTWNIGSGVSDTESASNDHTGTCRHAAARLRCVVSTPFGHARRARRVHLQNGVVGLAARARIDGRRCGQPRLVLVADRDDAQVPRHAAATSRATSTNSGPATSTGAPASVTTVVSSGAASRQFSGTATAPSFAQAANSSTTSGALRSRCATREPGPAPAASSAWASRFERSSSCA